MARLYTAGILLALGCCVIELSAFEPSSCHVCARIEAGWVCGRKRTTEHGNTYASFRSIPYAEQPVGEHRFKELRKKIPWHGYLDATEDGPVCPQYDNLYGRLVYPNRTMSEECIHVNVHVPLTEDGDLRTDQLGLPILVFVHGGGFQIGSGDADFHGPEYFVSKGIIVITFNYRLNVFGFLSLNTPEIPGNAGLRDVFTLLHWVQDNAEDFGGDPRAVTLAGQSAGAAVAHLVSIVHDCKSLFQRVILQSGTGIPYFYTASPIYANYMANLFLTELGINSTDTANIHKELIDMPLDKIIQINEVVQAKAGLVSFVPVVETSHSGVKRILDEDPYEMVKKGRGSQCPLIIGFTSTEAEFFRPRVENANIVEQIKSNSMLVLSPRLAYERPSSVALKLAERVKQRYFNGSATLDSYLNIITDTYFKYPALSLARLRGATGGAPVFMLYFAYQSDYSVIQQGLGIEPYKGAAHVEDLTNVFRSNEWLGGLQSYSPTSKDDAVKDKMINFFINFMACSDPMCSSGVEWPPVDESLLNYHQVEESGDTTNSGPDAEQLDMIEFFDSLETYLSSANDE